jgi:hypothetical protein
MSLLKNQLKSSGLGNITRSKFLSHKFCKVLKIVEIFPIFRTLFCHAQFPQKRSDSQLHFWSSVRYYVVQLLWHKHQRGSCVLRTKIKVDFGRKSGVKNKVNLWNFVANLLNFNFSNEKEEQKVEEEKIAKKENKNSDGKTQEILWRNNCTTEVYNPANVKAVNNRVSNLFKTIYIHIFRYQTTVTGDTTAQVRFATAPMPKIVFLRWLKITIGRRFL